MLVKNKHKSDTAGSYHITIVSFNKHFFKLYIFIMQGSSFVDVRPTVRVSLALFSYSVYDG